MHQVSMGNLGEGSPVVSVRYFRLSWYAWEMLDERGQTDFVEKVKEEVPRGYRLVSDEPRKAVDESVGIIHWLSEYAVWEVVPE